LLIWIFPKGQAKPPAMVALRVESEDMFISNKHKKA